MAPLHNIQTIINQRGYFGYTITKKKIYIEGYLLTIKHKHHAKHLKRQKNLSRKKNNHKWHRELGKIIISLSVKFLTPAIYRKEILAHVRS